MNERKMATASLKSLNTLLGGKFPKQPLDSVALEKLLDDMSPLFRERDRLTGTKADVDAKIRELMKGPRSAITTDSKHVVDEGMTREEEGR